MENNLYIIGDESSVIYYNINRQFSTVKKIIITKEIILGSYENDKIRNLITNLKTASAQSYKNLVSENKSMFEDHFRSELYQQIQQSLNQISNSYMDVKLKDYTFMNSVSNTKFNITLRCESFSITNYYIEKGTILTNIKNLIWEYLNFSGNECRLSRLDNFQIEIYESVEIYKHIYLKKENNALLLSATFGFPKNNPIDYSIGCEYYLSNGKDFKFIKNTQKNAIFREHTKLVEKEINPQEKILSNEDLVLINEKTKNMDDIIIEMYITSKNQLMIINTSLLETSISNYSDNGFIIYKSKNNYDRISIMRIHDNLDDETINPKYILLKNDSEIKEYMNDINISKKSDGIILTQNMFNPVFEIIGEAQNIDILYLNKQLQKSMDEKINWENFDIENSSTSKEENPFSEIISNQNKQRDELLEKLKNIDLSTPVNQSKNNAQNQEIQNAVNSIIGSSASSFNQNNNNNTMVNNSFSNGKKKSAIGMLAESVLNQVSQENRQQQNIVQENNPCENYNNDNCNSYNNNSNQNQVEPQNYQNSPFDAFESRVEQVQSNPQIVINKDLIEKYQQIPSIEIIATPNLDYKVYFADINTISQINGGKIYYLALSKEEMQNPNLKYVLPIRLNSPDVTNCSLLISNPTDFFLIEKKQKDVDYFIDISTINISIKKNFLEEMINQLGEISIICNKQDIDEIEETLQKNIHKIKRINVKNLSYNEELEEVKKKILRFEKKHLMKLVI